VRQQPKEEVKTHIVLLDTQTGKRVEVLEERSEGQEFDWSENNFSCDCNRSIFFGEDIQSAPCGNERYRIVECSIPELVEENWPFTTEAVARSDWQKFGDITYRALDSLAKNYLTHPKE
jgi:hypothetical protein